MIENPQTINLQRILQDTLEIDQLIAERKAALQLEGEGAKEAGLKKLNGGGGGGGTRKKLVRYEGTA